MDINLTLIGQMITFTIFVGFTMKFVWPPLREVMNNRQTRIAEGLSFADRAEKELQASKKEALYIIEQAKEKAIKIIDQANLRASKINEEAREIAQETASQIQRNANDEISEQIKTTKKQLRKEVVQIALASAEKLIRLNINAEVNNKLLEEMADKL